MLVPHVLVEFDTLLRKFVARGSLSRADAAGIHAVLGDLAHIQHWFDGAHERGFELSTAMGQSDTFDSTGYRSRSALAGSSGFQTGGLPPLPKRTVLPTSVT